jgi:hypothetical protein
MPMFYQDNDCAAEGYSGGVHHPAHSSGPSPNGPNSGISYSSVAGSRGIGSRRPKPLEGSVQDGPAAPGAATLLPFSRPEHFQEGVDLFPGVILRESAAHRCPLPSPTLAKVRRGGNSYRRVTRRCGPRNLRPHYNIAPTNERRRDTARSRGPARAGLDALAPGAVFLEKEP